MNALLSMQLSIFEEYFEIMTDSKGNENRIRVILDERKENSKIVGRLLEQLET